jgi:hypothetical protein
MKQALILVLLNVCFLAILVSCQEQKLPEVCGLKPILKSKCSPEKTDDECHLCILPFLKENCSVLKPEPGKEVDCEKVLGCVNGFLDQLQC